MPGEIVRMMTATEEWQGRNFVLKNNLCLLLEMSSGPADSTTHVTVRGHELRRVVDVRAVGPSRRSEINEDIATTRILLGTEVD
jgi:hypothetical protein